MSDLCDMTGLTKRTIRYYVHEGLVEPPSGRGRGGFYSDTQLSQLLQIKSLREKGMNLMAIMEYLRAGKALDIRHTRDVWVKDEILPGFEISVRRDIELKQRKNIFEIVRIAKSIVREGSADE